MKGRWCVKKQIIQNICVVNLFCDRYPCQLARFGYPDWGFFRAFSSVLRQMPGYNPQRRGTARTPPKFLCCPIYCLFCVVLCIVCVCICVLYYCHRLATQLQLTNMSYHIWYCGMKLILWPIPLSAGTLRLPWLRFFHAFSSVLRQMPRYNPQRRGTARTPPKFLCCPIYCLFCVVLCIVCVCICVLYYWHRVATQLQLTNISYHIWYCGMNQS